MKKFEEFYFMLHNSYGTKKIKMVYIKIYYGNNKIICGIQRKLFLYIKIEMVLQCFFKVHQYFFMVHNENSMIQKNDINYLKIEKIYLNLQD